MMGGRYDPLEDEFKSDNWNKMRYVESAENMTYIIPSFRESLDCFPDTSYYTATPQQVRDYNKETQRLVEEFGLAAVLPDESQKGQGKDEILQRQYFEHRRAIDVLRSELKGGIRDEIQLLKDQNALLRAQVGELQQQLNSLPSQIAALLRPTETQPRLIVLAQ
ncbi:hypothetical protein BGX33_011891 [Mortierella sp. NVP41]|nr:hypothetical protein BGX33_011891 [Mortierella sp. NVP41]